MPSSVPNLPGLCSIWDFSIRAGLGEKPLIAALRTDGVPLFELTVSGKKALFAQEDDLTAFIVRRATVQSPQADAAVQDKRQPATRLQKQLDSQADQLAQLRAQVESLMGEKA
jgi:hypothetical protein